MFVPYQILEQLQINNDSTATSIEDVNNLGMVTDKQFI